MESKNISKKENIINIILNCLIFIFGLILLISIYNNVQVSIFKKDYSDFFGYSVFEVQTGSMVPEINPGDWIIVKATNNIKVDDIITYKYDGEFITHRVIGVYNNTYVTKGDANNSKDDPIDSKQVIGEVVKILPSFGIIKKTILNPYVLVALISTILICNYVFKNTKKKEKKAVNKENIKLEEKNNKFNETINKIKKNNEIKKQKRKEKIENAKEQRELKETLKEEVPQVFTQPVIEQTEEEYEEMVEEISSYIPVDASELDDTFLEIAQNEIEEETEKTIIIDKTPVEEEVIKEKPTKLNLELLEKGKKAKNVIEKFISLKIDELNEIINLLDTDGKNQVNEPTIKNRLMSNYIESRYYNYYGNFEFSSQKKQIAKIEKYLEECSKTLKDSYKGSDAKFSAKVDKYLYIFNILANLEQAKELISDKKAKEEFYKNELLKYASRLNLDNLKLKELINEILNIQRNYVGIVDYLFKKFETSMFNLEINKLKTNKDIYCLYLDHNINFSKVYSDYIIDRTYNEGVIAESKLMILINLMSIKIIKDMNNSDFDKKYIINLPESLYSKGKKLEKILGMIEDEHAKESIIILLSMESLLKHKTTIRKFKKLGYKFAVAVLEQSHFDSNNHATINLVEMVFVDKNIPNIVKTVSILPEDIVDKIVYENIIDKIGDFGGEE